MKRLPSLPFVLLEDSQTRDNPRAGILFQNPFKVIRCEGVEKAEETLETIARFQAEGFYLAGWIGYETGYAFHPTLKKEKHGTSPEPLIWMGVFKTAEYYSSREMAAFTNKTANTLAKAGMKKAPRPSETPGSFENAFNQIQSLIRAGDIYQVNHTFRLNLDTFGNPWALYFRLRKAQPTPYSALINTGDWIVYSFSPELFLSRQGKTLVSRPMKGTAKPGRTSKETERRMKTLGKDEKNRAENLMITDLIRNDLSRVCEAGSVKTPKLFEVERWPTVLQMSSEVRGKLKEEVGFVEILKALFPCGSVTGAPKIRAMEIIRQTESSPRGLYTGALGFLAPGENFKFSVPIRTAVLSKKGSGWLGIGSGLVSQSLAKSEYAECLLKGHFLETDAPSFALIETLLWEPDKGFHFLEEHLARLGASAAFFNFLFDIKGIREKLKNSVETKPFKNPLKVRLTLSKGGDISISSTSFKKRTSEKPAKITLSSKKVNSEDPFLFHKTTNRALYDQEYYRAKAAGFLDYIFMNEEENLTEGAIHNLFIEGNRGDFLTPSLESGLLPGILRADLLKKGAFKESSLTCDDIRKARKIWLGNSISGLVEVKLEMVPKPNSLKGAKS